MKMKFKKNKNVNTIEYFAHCMCKLATCNCACICQCGGSSKISQSNYDEMDNTKYTDKFVTDLPTGDRSYM
ncbi:hypothetical protein [Sporanaerobacter acetigenes]|nr:hypothetical protein [Sporanaerobacter acetigenes]